MLSRGLDMIQLSAKADFGIARTGIAVDGARALKKKNLLRCDVNAIDWFRIPLGLKTKNGKLGPPPKTSANSASRLRRN